MPSANGDTMCMMKGESQFIIERHHFHQFSPTEEISSVAYNSYSTISTGKHVDMLPKTFMHT